MGMSVEEVAKIISSDGEELILGIFGAENERAISIEAAATQMGWDETRTLKAWEELLRLGLIAQDMEEE